jgi:hypothetical protein
LGEALVAVTNLMLVCVQKDLQGIVQVTILSRTVDVDAIQTVPTVLETGLKQLPPSENLQLNKLLAI